MNRKPHSVQLRLEVVRAYQSGMSYLEIERLFGVSSSTFASWIRRFKAEGMAGLEDRPLGRRQPFDPGAKTEAAGEIAKQVLQENPQAGISKIQGEVYRRGLLDIARETVRKMLRRDGVPPQERPRKRRHYKPRERSFERANPNDLWQTDIMTFMLKQQYRVYMIGFLDDNSRFIVGWGLYRFQTGANVLEVFRASIEKHGVPKEILSDNGRQYYTWRGRSQFTQTLTKLGIRHIRSRPYHPQTCGKIESFWRNLYQELLSNTPVATFEEAQSKIGEYIEFYNFKRPHQGIGQLVPADRYFKVAGQVQQLVEENTAKVEEQKTPPRGGYSPPSYIVGNIGGKELRVVAKDAEVTLKDAQNEEVKSGAAQTSPEGSIHEQITGSETEKPAGEAGPGGPGVGEGAGAQGPVAGGGGVEGAALPLDATDPGSGAQSLGSQEAGTEAAPAVGAGAGAAEESGGPGVGAQPPAQGEGSPGTGGGHGAERDPEERLGPDTH